MMRKIGVMDEQGRIHATQGITEAKMIINPPVDPYIEKYGPEFYTQCLEVVKEKLSPENWDDFKKHPKEVQESAIRLWIDEGQIWFTYKNE